MCLRIAKLFENKYQARKYASDPLIAENDIVVYKRLILKSPTRGLSPYQEFMYQKGFQYTEDTLKFKYNKIYCQNDEMYVIEVHDGLHAYIQEPSCNFEIESIVKMIVPKGSRYFLGYCSEIVTDNLIWY